MLAKHEATPNPLRAVELSHSQDEAALLRRVAAGDLRAFESLYRAYHPRLSRFLMNMTRRPQIVEEVLNDTLLVIWNRPDSFSGRSKLSTWVFGIAYRKALKAMRRQDQPIEDEHAESRPSSETPADERLERSEVSRTLSKAISELSPDHRAVVDLCYFNELGYREIAEIVDCPVDTVKTRMFHARRRLKARLPGELTDWL
jgi:RNA polymerase sigma-70 factor (ECF subfamily)